MSPESPTLFVGHPSWSRAQQRSRAFAASTLGVLCCEMIEYAVIPGKKTPGGAGTHTGRTQDTRAHKGTRVTPTNLTTIQPSKSTMNNTTLNPHVSGKGVQGPRASGDRIRTHAGPVSWVSTYNHWL